MNNFKITKRLRQRQKKTSVKTVMFCLKLTKNPAVSSIQVISVSMSFHYGAFLEGEGLPPYFRGVSPPAFWNARRGSPLMVAGSRDPISWDQFLVQVPGIAQLSSFVEREVAVMYDKAMCSFGASKKGQVLLNEELGSMFLPATIRYSGKVWPHR